MATRAQLARQALAALPATQALVSIERQRARKLVLALLAIAGGLATTFGFVYAAYNDVPEFVQVRN